MNSLQSVQEKVLRDIWLKTCGAPGQVVFVPLDCGLLLTLTPASLSLDRIEGHGSCWFTEDRSEGVGCTCLECVLEALRGDKEHPRTTYAHAFPNEDPLGQGLLRRMLKPWGGYSV